MFPVRLAFKYYFAELMGAMLLYMAALLSRGALVRALPDIAWLKTAVLLSPIVPVCLAAWAIVRLYTRTDEMYRKTMLENVAFGALFCAVCCIAWGFLEDVGAPKLWIGWAWPFMAAGWLLIGAWRGAKWAIAEQGFARTAKIAALVSAAVVLPTLVYGLVAPGLGWPHQPGILILFATAIFLVITGYQTFRKDREC